MSFQKQLEEITDLTGSGSANQNDLCIHCQNDKKDVALIPCGHVCLCKNCAVSLCEFGSGTCPMCNVNIREYLKVLL